MSRSVFKKVILGNDASGLDISDRISHLKFSSSIKQDDSLELYAEGDDARYLLELTQTETGKPVLFNFGYIGAEQSPTYRALITDCEPNYSADGLQIVIKCGDRGRTLRHHRAKKVWKAKSTDQVFREVAKTHGLNFRYEVPVGGFMQQASLPQANMSDLELLCMLASKEKDGNYICFVAGDTLNLVTRAVDMQSNKTIIVGKYDNLIRLSIAHRETTAGAGANEVGTAFGKINANTVRDNVVNGESAVYASSSALYIKKQDGTRTLLIDENGRKTAAAKAIFSEQQFNKLDRDAKNAYDAAKNADPQQKLPASRGVLVPTAKQHFATVTPEDNASGQVPNVTNGYELHTPYSQTQEETENQASTINKIATLRIVTATLEEYGDPYRTVNTIITIGGIATRYKGNWLVETVTHEVATANYTTSSTLAKNGSPNGAGKGNVTANNKPGEAAEGDGVFIGLQGEDNGRVFERDVKGNKKTIRFEPYKD